MTVVTVVTIVIVVTVVTIVTGVTILTLVTVEIEVHSKKNHATSLQKKITQPLKNISFFCLVLSE